MHSQVYVLHYKYLIEVATSIILSLILGFLLWFFNLWTEGDAKLYVAYTALIPLSIYNYGYFEYFPAYAIAVNTFIPLFLYYFTSIIIRSTIEQKVSEIKEMLSIKNLMLTVLLLFSIMWIPSLLFSTFSIRVNTVVQYFIVLGITLLIQRTFSRKIIHISIIVAALRLILDHSVYSLGYLMSFIAMTGIMIVLNLIVNGVSRHVLYKKVSAQDLKPRMVLVYDNPHEGEAEKKAESKAERNAADKMKELFSYLLKKREDCNGTTYTKDNSRIDLTSSDIDMIRKYLSETKIKNALFKIKETIPFAPCLFAGVLITLYFRGNMLYHIGHPLAYLLQNYFYIVKLTFAITILAVIMYLLIKYISCKNIPQNIPPSIK